MTEVRTYIPITPSTKALKGCTEDITRLSDGRVRVDQMKDGVRKTTVIYSAAEAEAHVERLRTILETGEPPATSSLKVGSWTRSKDGREAPYDMTVLDTLEKACGHMDIVQWSTSTINSPGFQKGEFDKVAARGSTPLFSLGTTGYTCKQVIAGDCDGWLVNWANAAQAWGKPIYLRINWEMQGNWFDWGLNKNGNTAQDVAGAYRHIALIMRRAANVKLVWCINYVPWPGLPAFEQCWPGADVVDVLGCDLYNWANRDGWYGFTELFRDSYRRLLALADKPVWLCEVGCTEAGGSKPGWITGMFAALRSDFPRVEAVVWFNKWEDNDWPVESSAAAMAAFARR